MKREPSDTEIEAVLTAHGITIPERALPQVRNAMRALKQLTAQLRNEIQNG